jgi:carboxypeptidase Q
MPNTFRRTAPLAALILTSLQSWTLTADDHWLDGYREPASRIVAAATSSDAAWQRLASMTDTFGHRLSGSASLEAAIRWAAGEMKQDFDEVRLEPVMVPRWVRGSESLEMLEPRQHSLVILGLGNSIGTPASGVQAEVLVVRSFAELDANASNARGRIVLFNVPFSSYGEIVQYRSSGASRAAAYGAVAALVRSVGPPGLRTAHTGALRYAADRPQIPAAAVATEDADRLQRMQDRGTRVVLHLRMDAKFLSDSESANLAADYRGREKPDEIVAIGCHIDSWDVGTGATDDGGGCIVMWEAVRVLRQLNLRPRRTIRVVFWTNEENGLRGGTAYRDRHRHELRRHVLMMESDSGVFRPLGFGFSGPDRARGTVTDISGLLRSIGADRIGPNGGGADIGPSVDAAGIPAMSLDVDGSKYFLIHHTQADTVDKIDPADMAKCVAAVAVMSYVVADMPQRLDK